MILAVQPARVLTPLFFCFPLAHKQEEVSWEEEELPLSGPPEGGGAPPSTLAPGAIF